MASVVQALVLICGSFWRPRRYLGLVSVLTSPSNPARCPVLSASWERGALFTPPLPSSRYAEEQKAYEGHLDASNSHLQQVRTFNGIDLTALEYEPFHGTQKVEPAGDLSGMWYDIEQKEKAEQILNKEDEDEKELAAAAVTA